jgi:hypothetical protein
MQMVAERRIAAPRDKVWAALNDVDVLRQSIPGCERLERTGDDEFVAEATAKVGPVKARFKGKVLLTEIDPPNGYRISGEGQGGPAGFAKGSANVTLSADGDDTVLTYHVDATVGGKLAQVGQRLIDAAARKMADDFFQRFTAIVSPQPATSEAAGAAGSETGVAAEASSPAAGVRPLVWVPLLIATAAALLYLFAR